MSPQEQPARSFYDPEKKECFILSLDGGGMRGIISTSILSEFCKILKAHGCNKDLTEVFDMVAGTSTGGLIASALTCPNSLGRKDDEKGLCPVKDLQNVYLLYGKDIFSEEVPSLLKAVSDKYSEKQFEFLLHMWYGSSLFSSCVIPTLIMGYNATAGLPFPMTSTENKTLYAWEVNRATSAAPTYFAPFKLGNQFIIDGGVIANNPSLYAYRYARTLWPNCKKIHILSISTCSPVYRYQMKASYGIASWTSVYKVYANAQMQTCDEMMESLPDVDYVRIYKELGDKVEMDDTREETLVKLSVSGKELARKFMPELEAFATRLLIRDQVPESTIAVEPPIQKRPSFLQRLRSWVRH